MFIKFQRTSEEYEYPSGTYRYVVVKPLASSFDDNLLLISAQLLLYFLTFPEDLRLNLVQGLVQTGTPTKDTSEGVTPTKPSYRTTHHSLVSIPFPLMWRLHQVLLVFGIVFTHNFFVSALLAL
jgi:hypothetical protein